jgi:spore maturation protein CgeB
MKILCVLSRFAYGKTERGENYDYVHFPPAIQRLGHEVEFFDSGDRSLYSDFADLNLALVRRVAAWQPDLIFCVLMHYEIWLETLDLIRANSPSVIFNWGTDDSWKFAQASRFFSEHVDLHVTTDAVAAAVAAFRGLENVLLSQWAASSGSFREPCPSQSCRYDVSFIGNMYGYRATWIEALRASGINVTCFGHGTENGVVDARMIPEIYLASRISLNFSGAGQGRGNNRQIKARTFEVPGAGGFLLTELSPDLEQYFERGKEIATFESPDELVAMARYYLDHPDQRDAIARAGHRRTTAEHSYEQRFSEILQRLELLRARRQDRPWTLSADALNSAVDRYHRRHVADWLRPVLVAALSALFGRERGPRAARRLIFELSWRLGGATTYCAGGLPGRLFYAES